MYVDGFVFVVTKKNRKAYIKMANQFKNFWRKHGGGNYRECRLVQVKPHKAVTYTFPMMVKPKKGEEVWFSYVEYPSKAKRDAVNKAMEKMMGEDMKKKGKSQKEAMKEMPFDMKRMAYGGFSVEVAS